MRNLTDAFQLYASWRKAASAALHDYGLAAEVAGVGGEESRQHLKRLQEKLADDRLSIAFVAEFSRGKSELINAIFFADYGQRIMPSSVGRTTMCPTELLYDAALPASIRLLPIQSRAHSMSVNELKQDMSCWVSLPLDLTSPQAMHTAFEQVGMTTHVSVETAQQYGLFDHNDPDAAASVTQDGTVEISAWRHAVVNFPHPLLEQGLVIIDTPGLNAIGTEPDLTLHLIPDAHVVLFVLGADTGVTKSDIAVWRNHIGGAGAGRIAVINKIDSMWDDLRTSAQVEGDIERQADSVAQTLGLQRAQVFPVSAQKALLAKIRHDQTLLEKSQLTLLEQSLSDDMVPARQEIVSQQLQGEFELLAVAQQAVLEARTRGVVEQLFELKSLRGKNQKVVEHMKKRVDIETKEFDASVRAFHATRIVLNHLSQDMFAALGPVSLNRDIRHARSEMDGSLFSVGMRNAVKQFFSQVETSLDMCGQIIDEIIVMMTAMYQKFSGEYGLAVSVPMPFSLKAARQEIDAIAAAYQQQFGTTAMLTTPQVALMQKFFDSIASRIKQTLSKVNHEIDIWLQLLVRPLDGQINEHRAQLLRRRDAIERICQAAEELEQKVQSLETLQTQLEGRKHALAEATLHLKRAFSVKSPASTVVL